MGAGGSDVWLLRTDANGTRLWDKTFGGAGNEDAASVEQTSDGYIMAGTTFTYGAGGSDAWVLLVPENNSAATPIAAQPKSAGGFEAIISAAGLLAAVYRYISRNRLR